MSLSWQHCTHLYYSPLSLCLTAAAHVTHLSTPHTHTGISGPRPIRGGVRPSLSLIGLDHDISLTGVSFVEPQSFWVADTFFSFLEWLDAPVRPGIFVSRTREKLGRTCDQIGRTLEPCIVSSITAAQFLKRLFLITMSCLKVPPPFFLFSSLSEPPSISIALLFLESSPLHANHLFPALCSVRSYFPDLSQSIFLFAFSGHSANYRCQGRVCARVPE